MTIVKPEYQVFKIDLSSASPAGGLTLDGQFGVFRFFRAEDADGEEVGDGLVSCNVQRTATGDEFPLKTGDAIFCPNVSRIRLTWAAHAGVKWAYFLSSAGPAEMEIDARPKLQLITGEISVGLIMADTLAARTFIGGGAKSGVASENSIVQLWNPADSGKNIYVTRLIYSNTVTTALNGVFLSSDDAAIGDTPETTGNNKTLGGDAPAAEIYADTLATPGGTNIARFPAPNNYAATIIDLRSDPIVVEPGRGVSVVTVGQNVGLTASFEWAERSV